VASGGALGCLRRVAAGGAPGGSCIISLKTVGLRAASVALNQNPMLRGFTVDGADVMTSQVRIAARKTVRLAPVFDADAASETKPDGGREVLTISWFATRKSFEFSRSGYAPPPLAPERTDTTWTDDTGMAGRVRFWVVMRDDRGGVGWTDGALEVAA